MDWLCLRLKLWLRPLLSGKGRLCINEQSCREFLGVAGVSEEWTSADESGREVLTGNVITGKNGAVRFEPARLADTDSAHRIGRQRLRDLQQYKKHLKVIFEKQ